ncbi:FeoB-associated Cys-rich membrane protein [Numidum massiliense]|uniref:FeoB-associated Cys-rich membrane protein n=1 Tax=Numidum massiliense TaxID=1522315 RepID=UPI0006D57595|nr:FeoB-associated Cys-rich membrane protein [Numidum massiliense]
MLASIVLGVVILGYSAWALVRFVKKSKQGACAACSIKDSCQKSDCCSMAGQTVEPDGR